MGPLEKKGQLVPLLGELRCLVLSQKFSDDFKLETFTILITGVSTTMSRHVTHDEHVSQGPDTVRASRPCRPTWEVAIGHAARTNRKELFFG